MRSARPVLLLALVAALALPALAREPATPPPPSRWVTDPTGFLSTQARASLDAKLEAYERGTGHQVLVWIGRSTGGVPVEDFAERAFKAWRVGRKGLDDGLVLFIFPDDRRMRIEVGYGLEDRVPDATASTLIRDILTPGFRAGQNDAAVTRAVDALTAAIEGKAVGVGGSGQAPEVTPQLPSTVQWVLFGLVGLAFLLLLITHPSLALNLLFIMASGGRHRGGGWGGGGGRGGFSGGGGRSGGGGASGSW